MNSKIIAGIGILVVLIAVYFIFFSEQKQSSISFSEGVTEINSLWQKNNVNSSYLLGTTELSFSASDLESLDSDLREFRDSLDNTTETESLKDFTEIHLMLVDELVLALELKETNDKLKSKTITGDNLCENKTDLLFVAQKTIELNEKMLSVNELVYAFNEMHSGLEEEANLTSFIADDSGFSQTKLENEIVIDELESAC